MIPHSSEPLPSASTQPARFMTAALVMGLVAAALAFALFAWLGRGIVLGVTWPLDTAIRDGIHSMASTWLTRVMIAASLYGGPTSLVTLGVIVAAIFLWRGWHRGVLLVVLTMAGAALLDTMLKLMFGRARPAAFFDYPLPQSLSFPSGHAFFSASFLGGFAVLISGRLRNPLLRLLVWVVTIALILLIGFSRIYLGVHYPSDVLAGYAVAVVWVTAIAVGDRVASHRRHRQRTT
jgi:undecaprenyl-diphosphatase